MPGFEDPWDVVSSYVLRARSDNSIIINVAKVSWFVDFHPACEVWANNLEQADAEALLAAVRVLRDQGPSLGRPLVDNREGQPPSEQEDAGEAEGKEKGQGQKMSLKEWEKKVLAVPGAAGRVADIEDELRLAAGLTALREQAGLSQRELAKRIGVSQPRIAAIEQSHNITMDVLEQYVEAVGGRLEVTVVKGKRKIPLLRARHEAA